MIGGLRTRVGKAVAAWGALALVAAGGTYALVLSDSEEDRQQVAGTGTVPPTTLARPLSTVAPDNTSTALPENTSESTEVAAASAPAPAPAQADPGLAALQERLATLGYDPGPADGFFGWQTSYAISAFLRVEGLDMAEEYSPELLEAANAASTPGPMVPGGESNRVEVDIDRQVLFLWQGGALARILPVSTGNGEYYCVEGECDTAITPTGMFRIGRKYPGLEVSRLGELYHPSYFYGGIAIHGSPSVPRYPASHGCVRVPLYAAASLYDQTPSGMAVYVVGSGPSAASVPPPPDEPVQVQDPPSPPPTEPQRPAPTTPTTEAPIDTTPDTTIPTLTVPSSTTSTTVEE